MTLQILVAAYAIELAGVRDYGRYQVLVVVGKGGGIRRRVW